MTFSTRPGPVALAFSFALAVACGDSDPESPATPDLEPLTTQSSLEQVIDRVNSAPANFSTLTGTRTLESHEGTFQEVIWIIQPDRWRMEITGDRTDLGSLVAGDTVITDGSHFWLSQPARKRYCEDTAGESEDATLAGSATAGWPPEGLETGTIAGQEAVANRSALGVELGLPRVGSSIWVDALTGVILRFEHTSDTAAIARGTYTTVSFDTTLDENLFAFQPEAGMQKMPCEDIVNY